MRALALFFSPKTSEKRIGIATDFMEKFKRYLKEDGKSPRTIESYVGDIAGFVAYIQNMGVKLQGKLISINGTLKDSIGVKNPYRYRGYRYDSETGFYYLSSRYYNPEWGRLISADTSGGKAGELLSHNVFAYCLNNPVNMTDPNGFMPKWAKWAIAAVAVVVVAVVAATVIPVIAAATVEAYYSVSAAITMHFCIPRVI